MTLKEFLACPTCKGKCCVGSRATDRYAHRAPIVAQFYEHICPDCTDGRRMVPCDHSIHVGTFCIDGRRPMTEEDVWEAVGKLTELVRAAGAHADNHIGPDAYRCCPQCLGLVRECARAALSHPVVLALLEEQK